MNVRIKRINFNILRDIITCSTKFTVIVILLDYYQIRDGNLWLYIYLAEQSGLIYKLRRLQIKLNHKKLNQMKHSKRKFY